MKDVLKQDWMYLLIILGLSVLTFIQVTGFSYGFFTAYDEAYFLLKLQEAYDMSCITGKSQWNLIAIHWFPYLDLTSKVSSYLASEILIWVSIIIVTITSCILYNPKRAIKYLALAWLVMFGLGGGLSYVPMQTAVLCWALCAFMLYWKSSIVLHKVLYATLCGICIGFSLFIIIPAALILLAIISLLIIISQWGNWRDLLQYIGFGVIGVLLTCLYMHVIVCPLEEILDAMLFTASYIGKSGYNYDGTSFLFQYGLFFRDCLFVVIAFVGSYWLSKRFTKNWLGGIFYIGLILMYTHYQVKPQISSSMFMMSLPIIPFLFGNSSNLKLDQLKNADSLFYLFIFSFPIIASLGTNTALSGRIHCFVIAWLFLWFEHENKFTNEHYNRVLISVLLLLILPLNGVIKSYNNRDNSHHFTRGNKNFAEIALTEKQVKYFNNVYDILDTYNFQPKKSVIMTAGFDYCCLYAFDAVNASNYHQVQNFHYFPKENMIKPDFVFLCKWDSIVMAKELAEMSWGWPEEFDAYYVGTPEDEKAAYVNHPELERRTLYCRKKQ